MAIAGEGKILLAKTTTGYLLLFITSAILVLWAGFSSTILFFNHDQSKPKHAVLFVDDDDDDMQCLSRTQVKKLLWNSNVSQIFTPSPQFIKAWDDYTKLHRKCTEGRNFSQDGPFRLHTKKELKEEEGDGKTNDCLFLIFDEGPVGLGNRLISLVSAFAYALLTNRVILLRPSGILPKLLCQVFPHNSSSWILPATVPNIDLAFQKSLRLKEFLDGNPSNKTLVFLNLDHDQSADDEKFFCEETQTRLRSHQWLAWHSNQYYVPQLFMIPSLWPSLTELFPEPSQVFLHLGRRLILPNNDVWGIIVWEYRSYMAGAKSKLGLQLRLHGYKDIAGFYIEIERQIHRCFQTHNVLPATNAEDGVIGNAAELASLSKRNRAPDIVLLVASLNGRYAESLQQRYSFGAIDEDGHYVGVRVHSPSHFWHQNNKDLVQSQLALAEIWLLSFCEHLVTSPTSTFGYVAHGIAQMPPFILRFDDPIDYNENACQVGQSAEPCCHYPKWPTCIADSMGADHKEWIRTHTRHCQDRPDGIQFINMKARTQEGEGEIVLGKELFL